MKILHLSDIHLGSGFTHGKPNPENTRNSRFEDFEKSISVAIDRGIAEDVDLVLFGGDAFPNATPEPYIQQAFARQFRRLGEQDIPSILLVGNHDQHSQGKGGASLSIYNTLDVPNIYVGDTMTTLKIDTKSGSVQVITIPWPTRHTLLTKEKTDNLSSDEVDQLLLKTFELALEGEIRQLSNDYPTIVLAHLMVDNARFGAERSLAVGKGFTVPLSMLLRSNFDYVALGHVHCHQNLNPTNDPPVIYPGSIDRVDFGEEKEQKGYVLVNIEKEEDQPSVVNWEFCPIPVRPFRTIKVDVSKSDRPQEKILQGIAKNDITDAVVRLIYKIDHTQSELIQDSVIHESLSTAHTYTIQAELISQLTQPRLPELGTHNMDPLEALNTYLESRTDLDSIANEMIKAARELDNNDDLEDDLPQLKLL